MWVFILFNQIDFYTEKNFQKLFFSENFTYEVFSFITIPPGTLKVKDMVLRAN